MAGLKSSKYYDELSDLVFAEQGNSSRANKIFDILDRRGFPTWSVKQNIADGLDLPGKEEFKTGGMIKRKMGGKIVKRQEGGQIGKPRGWGSARYVNK